MQLCSCAVVQLCSCAVVQLCNCAVVQFLSRFEGVQVCSGADATAERCREGQGGGAERCREVKSAERCSEVQRDAVVQWCKGLVGGVDVQRCMCRCRDAEEVGGAEVLRRC